MGMVKAKNGKKAIAVFVRQNGRQPTTKELIALLSGRMERKKTDEIPTSDK